jgi:alkylation response protein AidB-like acyl-CoA dehydrogenase
VSAEICGAIEKVFELARDYASERVQFGRVIGSFQRVQDMVIAIRNHCDAARLAVWHAAATTPTSPEFDFRVSVAKAVAGQAATEATFQAHEVFGGVGFMMEHDLQLYTRRAKMLALLLGSTHSHLTRVGDRLLSGPSRADNHLREVGVA